ncbi:MAG: porin [Proteobacteria bacterium]|nr:porin [Pseudomonadota bacterium]
MNIKSLLIGSAAALVAFSGAQAADAIVAAEPEAVEYVKVCDAFGTGYFYIPGTETCLKIAGLVRVQADFGKDVDGQSDFNTWALARVNFTAKNDTELGALTSFIEFEGGADEYDGVGISPNGAGNGVSLRQAYIDIAGVRAGWFYSWWDDDLSGDTDALSSHSKFAAVQYTYTGESFSAGLSVEELEHGKAGSYSTTAGATTYTPGVVDGYDVGVTGMLSGAFGPVKATLLASYDIDAEEYAVRGIATAAIGPGTLGFAAAYASGTNQYYAVSEWTVAAEYAFKATDKLTITPGAQYFGDVGFKAPDAYQVGLTLDYAVTAGLAAKAQVTYYDEDKADGVTTGYLRIQRDF